MTNYKNKFNPFTGKLQKIFDGSGISVPENASDINNDSSVSGSTVKDALETLNTLATQENYEKVKNIINSIDLMEGDVILTDTDSGALQIAIDNLTDGQILEIKTNATYTPIEIPSGKSFKIKVSEGYFPKISGQNCLKLNNGVNEVTISGLIFENYSTSDVNGKGSAIYLDHEAKISNVIFHRIIFSENTNGSAVLLSYHQSTGGDLYYTANELNEMSEKISFIGCKFFKACKDGTEGAELLLRGVKNVIIEDCSFDNEGTNGRGIMLHNCIYSYIKKNRVKSPGGSNGEGIKIDKIGTPSYKNTVIVTGNLVKDSVEGIDIDDAQSALVIDNTVLKCEEGISIDDSSSAVLIHNICYNNQDGIYLESGATTFLNYNICFLNTINNYKIENGYSLPDSNSEDIEDVLFPIVANNIAYEGTLTSTNVTDALNELDSAVDSAISTNKIYTFNLPTTTLANGESIQIHRFTVPSGLDVKIWSAGLSSEAGAQVSGAKIQIYNETDVQEEYSTNLTFAQGEPLDTLNVAGKDISIKILNDSGLSGDFNGFISITLE